MELSALRNLIQQGESETLEVKRSTGQRTEAMKTVCALLNGRGGFVVFGVTDAGQLTGQLVSTETEEQLAFEIRRIEPPAFPAVELVPLDNGQVAIVLRVSGGGGPYAYDGRPYQRVGPTTSQMPRERYQRLLLEQMHASHRWENQPATGFNTDDLDHAEIVRTVDEAIRRGRLDDPGSRAPEAILSGLGLIQSGELLNAAVILFGQTQGLLPRYPQALLRMARFRGTTKSEFIDNRQEHGNAFDLFVRAQRFMRDHLPIAGRIVPNVFERIDDPLYPMEALREALVNAICHRDYGIGSSSVSVAIYDDRLEIASTGILPFGLTPDDLVRPHQSRPWNPLIANAFYRRGLNESWGRGTIKMAEITVQAGLAQPEFEVSGGEVIVRFIPTRYVAPTQVSHHLTSLQQSILNAVGQLESASLRDIRSTITEPIQRRTLQNNLQMLKELGVLETSGHGPGARWIVRRKLQGISDQGE